MIGKKDSSQKQEVTDHSTAVQIQEMTGPMQIGMSFSEVRTLILDMLDSKIPQFQEQAKQTALLYVEDFTNCLKEKIAEELQLEVQSQVLESFKNPEVNFILDDAVRAMAKLTDKIDINLLSNLVYEKCKSIDSDDLLLNEAIKIISELNHTHILFLALIYSLRNTEIRDSVTQDHVPSRWMNWLETYLSAPIKSTNISFIDFDYLASKFVIPTNATKSYNIKTITLLKDKLNLDDLEEDLSLKQANSFTTNLPNLTSTLLSMGIEDLAFLDGVPLTKLGELIATQYLTTHELLK